jgi:hypothetical protein
MQFLIWRTGGLRLGVAGFGRSFRLLRIFDLRFLKSSKRQVVSLLAATKTQDGYLISRLNGVYC